MGIFLVFILKSTLCLAVFYLFYRLLLSRDTFHRFNRIALLSVILFSVIIPFIRLASDAPVALQRPVQSLEYLLLMAQMEVEAEAEPTNLSLWLTLIFSVYAGGCLFFAIRFLMSVGHILQLIKSGKKIPLDNGIRLVVTDKSVSPFSWMKYIVISRIDLKENGKEILIHEKAHIKSCHSFDMLLAGICSIFHWFNPASWLLKQELQNVHEYEADEQVILQGVDEKHYQLLLIKKAVGTQRFTSMANSFNHSKLKKRITMMLRQKSSSYGRLKYLYVLPLTAVAVVAFARPEISRELEKISSVKVIETPVLPQTSPAEKVTAEAIASPEQTIPVPQRIKKVEKKVTAVPSDSVKVVGYRTMPNAAPEEKKNVVVVEGLKHKPLYVLDGVENPDLDPQTLDPATIQSVSVLKEGSATKVYGTRGRNGVILISTHRGNTSIAVPDLSLEPVQNFGFKPRELSEDSLRVTSTFKLHGSKQDPLLFIDGKEVPYEEMAKLSPDRISSISIMKEENAVKIYGERAKDKGVLLITLKKE
jgi:TonB-dependent SusC/RagA subfamily outer membrane receptor